MNRWHVYEYLKRIEGEIKISEVMRRFDNVQAKEVAEGVAEYCETYRDLNRYVGSDQGA